MRGNTNGKDGAAGSIPAGGSTKKPQVRLDTVRGMGERRQLRLPEICQLDLYASSRPGQNVVGLLPERRQRR
jgi:hypothetical protein